MLKLLKFTCANFFNFCAWQMNVLRYTQYYLREQRYILRTQLEYVEYY